MAKTAFEQWDSVAANNSDIDGIPISENCPAAGINNAIRAQMAQLATWLASLFAAATDLIVGTSATKAITPDAVHDAAAWTSASYSSSYTIDQAALSTLKIAMTLTGNISLGNISNKKIGVPIELELTQDGTGNRTITWGSDFKAAGGLPSLTTTAGAIDRFILTPRSSSVCYVDYGRSYSA